MPFFYAFIITELIRFHTIFIGTDVVVLLVVFLLLLFLFVSVLLLLWVGGGGGGGGGGGETVSCPTEKPFERFMFLSAANGFADLV